MTRTCLTMFETVEKAEIEARSIAPESFYQAFAQVKDGRKAKGKRSPLPLLLTLPLLGKLAGETKVRGIIQGIKERQGRVRAQLDWPRRFPVPSTSGEALACCDGEQIASAVAQVILKARAVEQCGAEPSRLQANKQQETLTHVASGWQNLTRNAQTSARRTACGASLGLLRLSEWDCARSTRCGEHAKMR